MQEQIARLETRKRSEDEKARRIAAEVNKRVAEGREKLAIELERQRAQDENQRLYTFSQRLLKEEELGRQMLEFRKNVAAEAHKRVQFQLGAGLAAGAVAGSTAGSWSATGSVVGFGQGSRGQRIPSVAYSEDASAPLLLHKAVHAGAHTSPAVVPLVVPRTVAAAANSSVAATLLDGFSQSAVITNVAKGRKVDYL